MMMRYLCDDTICTASSVGMSPGSQGNSGFNLSRHQDKDNLLNSLDTTAAPGYADPDFADLVRDLRRTAFRYRNGARKGAKRVAVLIIDGNLDNPLDSLTEAQRMRDKKGVEIYVVSVGTELPQQELMMMCDYPVQKHFYQVNSYDRLEDMRETLVDVLCDGKACFVDCLFTSP